MRISNEEEKTILDLLSKEKLKAYTDDELQGALFYVSEVAKTAEEIYQYYVGITHDATVAVWDEINSRIDEKDGK